MERPELPEQPERLDIRVPLVLGARLDKLDKPGLQVQAVLRAKRVLQELAALPESQEKQELRASLELLGRLVKRVLLEKLGLPVPPVRVVVQVKLAPREALAKPVKLDQLD